MSRFALLEQGYSSLYWVGVVGQRVIRQLKRERRTIALIIFAPLMVMVLFGYALSGDMSGIRLGLVAGEDGPLQRSLVEHLTGVDAFQILRLASESDAERLISEQRLHGAVVLGEGDIRVLLDGAVPQIASTILAQVQTGASLGARAILESTTAKGDSRSVPPSIEARYIYGYDLEVMDSVGPAVVGLVVFFFTFLMTTVFFLRERTLGTLEKFLVSPLSRMEMVLGYVVGFVLYTFVQSAISLFLVVALFGVPMRGSITDALFILMLLGVAALSLGALFSNFARSEFQVVQFIPLVIMPQVALTGVWWPLESVPTVIRPVAYILPLTYCNDALRAVMLRGASLGDVLMPDLLVLGLFFAVTFILATLMLSREVA